MKSFFRVSRPNARSKTGPGFTMTIADAMVAIVLIGAGSASTSAQAADTAKPAAPAGGGHASAAEIGKKLSNPLSDVWALFTEFDYIRSKGDLSGQGSKTGTDMIFQPVMPFKLTKDWKMITRPVVPISFSVPVPEADAQHGIEFKDRSGLGDISVPFLFTPVSQSGSKDAQSWTLGGGPTFTFPTATSDYLGTNTWEAGPAAVVVYKTPKITVGAFGQYWWSFAKTGSNTADTSHGTLLYFLWYDLPDAWQVGTGPTISYNNKASSGNQWNVPVGLMAAKTVKFGKLPIKFQFGVEKSVVRQDDFGKDWTIKLNIIPVIPALVKNPIF